eukprot:gnl/Chilomastix_cuspidata/1226.p1 GENE.gnl/Chilomastix_cuspidata/1226~~gnl/Chilomastix_cuspidata/1226.p1  ORF type:complete len:394 (-),score=166.69 gnl/Chilomastix_cuspidata/1226:18-1199(-)
MSSESTSGFSSSGYSSSSGSSSSTSSSSDVSSSSSEHRVARAGNPKRTKDEMRIVREGAKHLERPHKSSGGSGPTFNVKHESATLMVDASDDAPGLEAMRHMKDGDEYEVKERRGELNIIDISEASKLKRYYQVYNMYVDNYNTMKQDSERQAQHLRYVPSIFTEKGMGVAILIVFAYSIGILTIPGVIYAQTEMESMHSLSIVCGVIALLYGALMVVFFVLALLGHRIANQNPTLIPESFAIPVKTGALGGFMNKYILFTGKVDEVRGLCKKYGKRVRGQLTKTTSSTVKELMLYTPAYVELFENSYLIKGFVRRSVIWWFQILCLFVAGIGMFLTGAAGASLCIAFFAIPFCIMLYDFVISLRRFGLCGAIIHPIVTVFQILRFLLSCTCK